MPLLDDHPLACLFPLMTDAELDELGADIEANGLQEPIWLYEGKILDGRNRYRACAARDVDHRVEYYRGRDPLGFVASKNLHRRHLTTSQRAMAAAEVATLKHGGDRRSDRAANMPVPTQAEAAAKLKVSERAVRDAVKVAEEGVPELAAAVKAGHVTVSAAAEVARLPEEEQAEVVAAGPERVKERAAESRRERAAPASPPPPPVETRPPPHQTRARDGKPAAKGVGGEVSRWPVVERAFGALVRAVDDMARVAAQTNGRSHREALALADQLLAHMKKWNDRLTKQPKKESAG